MRDYIRKALTKKHGRTEIPPSQRLVLGIQFAIVALLCLTGLEIAHMVVVRAFSSEIFAAISLVVGTILGAVFGQRA
jgi:thiosulfate reductase cytochrome b subunit